ncbi:hypothetical protein I5F06_00835 [Proteus mirabilis]|nr:hypothetical protein [Proteus mirabilis]
MMIYLKKLLMAFSISLTFFLSTTAIATTECPPTQPDCGGDVWIQSPINLTS